MCNHRQKLRKKATLKYIKNMQLFFVFSGIDKKSNAWLEILQNMFEIRFFPFKINKKASKNVINSSIFQKFDAMTQGNTFFFSISHVKFTVNQFLLYLNTKFKSFNLIAIKMNKDIYPVFNLINSLFSFKYSDVLQVLYQAAVYFLKNNSK